MNSSAPDQIPKSLTIVNKQYIKENINDIFYYYKNLKTTGFLYGTSTEALTSKPLSKLNITRYEYTKINLFQSLILNFLQINPMQILTMQFLVLLHSTKYQIKEKLIFFISFLLQDLLQVIQTTFYHQDYRKLIAFLMKIKLTLKNK